MIPSRVLGPAVALSLLVPAGLMASQAQAQQAPVPTVTSSPSPGHQQASYGKPTEALRTASSAQSESTTGRSRHGEAELAALGNRLASVAAKNKLSAARLTHILTTDPTAWLRASGQLFYADPYTSEVGRQARSGDIAPPQQPLGNTFTLHSDPTSTHVIYLDFDGFTLPSTAKWVADGFHAGTYRGFSIDSNYGAFSDAEKAYIQEVWRIVAEKYSTFDVDVTTQDPGSDAYNRNGVGDTTYGDHVVFTNDPGAKPAAVCPSGCLGISYVGGFGAVNDNASYLEPSWIYTSDLTDIPSYTANVAAHEIGHTLGLHHDGTNALGADSYYAGQGNWFPIMGAGYNAVGQFSKGEYQDANNFEDDLAVIQSNGAPEKPDDYGGLADPTVLPAQTSYSIDGTIGDAGDKDVFAISRTCVDDLHATATGIGEGQALDIKLTIRDSSGNVLASDDPPSNQATDRFPYVPLGLDADVTLPAAQAPAATYEVEVEGVGSGDPAVDGYSNYGSIGTYHLTISGCDGALGALPGAPSFSSVDDGGAYSTQATVYWDVPPPGDAAITGYVISGLDQGVIETTSPHVTLTLVPGAQYYVNIAAVNKFGTGPVLQRPIRLLTWTPLDAPTMSFKVVRNELRLSYFDPPNPGHATFDTWHVLIDDYDYPEPYGAYTGLDLSGIPNGHHTIHLYLDASADDVNAGTIAYATFNVGMNAPKIGRAGSGTRGRPITASIKWTAPTSLGGYAITAYRVAAYKLDAHGHITRYYVSARLKAKVRSYSFRLPAGRYKFRVAPYNANGQGPISGYSKVVTAR